MSYRDKTHGSHGQAKAKGHCLLAGPKTSVEEVIVAVVWV